MIYLNLVVLISIDNIFLVSRLSLSVFGVLWRPFSCRGFCQMSYLAPTNWELPTRITRTPVSIICKHCLWKGAVSDNYIYFFFFFWLTLFVFLDVLSLFHIVPYRNLTVWIFHLLSFLCYLDSVCQLLGSYGGHVLVLDPVKWAILRLRAESLQFETLGLLFPSSANLVCGRQRCPTTSYIFFEIFWLASWGGRKLETFADNVERQRWKNYRKIFAEIVAIQSTPLFF